MQLDFSFFLAPTGNGFSSKLGPTRCSEQEQSNVIHAFVAFCAFFELFLHCPSGSVRVLHNLVEFWRYTFSVKFRLSFHFCLKNSMSSHYYLKLLRHSYHVVEWTPSALHRLPLSLTQLARSHAHLPGHVWSSTCILPVSHHIISEACLSNNSKTKKYICKNFQSTRYTFRLCSTIKYLLRSPPV